MITISDAFKTSIIGDSRKTASKIIFQIVDTTAMSDASAAVTSEASISQKTQISNGALDMSGKYATFENDYWLLDGSFCLPPKNTETSNESGWWSSLLCGSGGVFSTPQVVTITFSTAHTSLGLTICFDSMTNEYAKDFTVTTYDASNNVLHTVTVTNNTLSKYIWEQGSTNYKKIVISITKWATGYRRARICEVGFGIVEEYTGKQLTSVNIIEEVDTTSNVIPANEMNFTLYNENKKYNIINPSGYYPYLQRKQKVTPYLGVEKATDVFEYVPMGEFYLTEWKSNEGALTATFTARDILDALSQSDYAGATFTSKTLTYIATAIFTACGTTNYSIDTALNSITVSGTLAKMDYRQALQLVAMAGKSVLYSDRTGKVIIKQLSTFALAETISLANMYASPEIKLDKLINTITFDSTAYTYTDPAKPSTEEILSIGIVNSLINDNTIAENVAGWILAEYNKRFLYSVNWRGNPAYETGDILTVEDEFAENKTVTITKQEFTFQGYLNCKTYGKGGGK